MKFLVANDDGIFAPGIKMLAETLAPFGTVAVVGPTEEQSGMGHAITVHRPLRVQAVDVIPQSAKSFTVDGTPADCVKMAVQGLGLTPDIVMAGINLGSNLGTDVLYSGTVSAAMEGVILGIRAIAVSLCGPQTYLSTAGHYVRKILFEDPGILNQPNLIPQDGLLNINIPAVPIEEVKGIRVTRLGVRKYENLFEKRVDPRGNTYFWMGGKPQLTESSDLDIDIVAVEQGYVSITPIQFDLTYHSLVDGLQTILNKEYI